MPSTTENPTTGPARVLATYTVDDGKRELVGQRVGGAPRITDRPLSGEGRSFLVEDNIASMAELGAIVDDYVMVAERTGWCPMQELWF